MTSPLSRKTAWLPPSLPIALAWALLFAWAAIAAERPNVILVMTDDQGYGDIRAHGNPVIRTPNLDRLHAESVRFTDFHVSPFCTPTRAALLTGRYAARTGAYRTAVGRSYIHPREVTMAQTFASNGYKTGLFGKWHLGDNYPSRPIDKGFQQAVWHRCGGVTQISDYWGNDYFDDTYLVNDTWKKFEGYCTDVWFREAMRFIKENKDGPFFVYIPTNAPHGPYLVAERYKRIYQDLGDEESYAAFKGMVTNFDENLGLLLESLEQMNLAGDTILIFLTDNGSSRGARFEDRLFGWPVEGFNAGMRGGKSSAYDGGHRVPLFIRWPRGNLGKPRDIDTLTAHIDLLPTLMDLCQLERPAGPVLDGLSLKPLLRGDAGSWTARTLFSQIHGDAYFRSPEDPWAGSAVMTERWRLVKGRELYDIRQDPAQRNDIAADNPTVVRRLRRAHESWYADVSKGMRPTRIVVGDDAENPTDLTSQDWFRRSGGTVWSRGHVLKRQIMNGPWLLNIARASQYRFTLSRWPRYIRKPIESTAARIKIGSFESTRKIARPGQTTEVTFETSLPAGPVTLETWLTTPQGETHGAYFVTVERR